MLKVFWCDVSEADYCNYKDVQCLVRKKYINSIRDPKRKKQSFFVWKLLEYVSKKQFGCDKIDGEAEQNGKWRIKGVDFKFSLSHSDNIVAVAVSDASVGVDVEKYSDTIMKVRKFLLKNGEKDCCCDTEKLILLWTERESFFKCSKNNVCENLYFSNKNITDRHGNNYCCGVCGKEHCTEFYEILSREL